MANFQDNPFGDPGAQQEAPPSPSKANYGTIDDYNPFADDNRPSSKPVSQPPPSPPPVYQPTPPVTANVPPPGPATAPTSDLQERQAELERKAAELEAREKEMAQMAHGSYCSVKTKNFPPLPSWFPINPCFYQDISVEINPLYQWTVRMGLILWIIWMCTLILNMFALLIFLCAPPEDMSGTALGTSFGLSLLWIILFIPLSTIGWQRTLYKAFRSDSSINFMIFFLAMFFQIIISGVGAGGFPASGWCGIFLGASCSKNPAQMGIAMVVGIMFLGQLGAQIFLLIRTHRLYRHTDASVSKAQSEFAQGALKNPSIQKGVAAGVSSAVSSQNP